MSMIVTGENSNSSLTSQNSNNTIDNYFPDVPCPYLGWRQYLPDTLYSDQCQEVSLVKAAETFLKKHGLVDREILEEKRYFYLDVEKLLSDDGMRQSWPELGEMIDERAEHVCGIFGLTMHHLCSRDQDQSEVEEDNKMIRNIFPIVKARLENCQNIVHLRDIKSSYFQRLVCVQGTAVKVNTLLLVDTSYTLL